MFFKKNKQTKQTEELLNEYVLVKCEKCDEMVPFGWYCSHCGSRIPHIRTSILRMNCKVCGGSPSKGNYCSRCGTFQGLGKVLKPYYDDTLEKEIHTLM